MKKISLFMNLLMGFIMSFVLSLTGTLTGGHFTIPSWLLSFGASLILSLIIGFIIPIKPLSDSLSNAFHIKDKTFGKRLFDSFISNVLYTPLLSATMVFLAWSNIPEEHRPSFITLYTPSLIVTFIVGLIVIFIVQPLFLKMLLKKSAPEN